MLYQQEDFDPFLHLIELRKKTMEITKIGAEITN